MIRAEEFKIRLQAMRDSLRNELATVCEYSNGTSYTAEVGEMYSKKQVEFSRHIELIDDLLVTFFGKDIPPLTYDKMLSLHDVQSASDIVRMLSVSPRNGPEHALFVLAKEIINIKEDTHEQD